MNSQPKCVNITWQTSLIKMLNIIQVLLSFSSLHHPDFSVSGLMKISGSEMGKASWLHISQLVCLVSILCRPEQAWRGDCETITCQAILSVCNEAHLSDFVIWKQMIHREINPENQINQTWQYIVSGSDRKDRTTCHIDFN